MVVLVGLVASAPAVVRAARHAPAAPGDDRTSPPEASQGKLRQRLDALGARRGWGWLRRALQVQERYRQVRGDNLAAAVTLRAFVSLFPLLLLATAIAGFVAGSGTDVAGDIVSAFGLTGSSAAAIRDTISTASSSAKASSVIGLAGLAWSALGLVAALQYGVDQVWQVEDRGVRDRAVGAAYLVGVTVLFVGGSAALTVVQWLPGPLSPLGVAGSVALTFVLWLWTLSLLPNVDVGWRTVVPGAVLGTIGLEVLKLVGAYWVPRAVASSSQLYGTIGVVFAVLAWLLLFGRLLVYATVLNVVLFERDEGTVRATVEIPAHDKARGGVLRSGLADRAA